MNCKQLNHFLLVQADIGFPLKKNDILNKHFNICKSRELFDLVS